MYSPGRGAGEEEDWTSAEKEKGNLKKENTPRRGEENFGVSSLCIFCRGGRLEEEELWDVGGEKSPTWEEGNLKKKTRPAGAEKNLGCLLYFFVQ
jgi:hypothetical protein